MIERLFTFDVLNEREESQKVNNEIALNALLEKVKVSQINKFLNIENLKRVLKQENITYDELLKSCKDDFYTRNLARYLAKNSSRQGKKVESLIIEGVSTSMRKYGFNINACGVNDLRFTKTGKVLNEKEFNKLNLNKNIDSHKSIDGLISGLIEGYIIAKVVIGNGGHQDNVLHEIINYIEWINNFWEKDKLYVFLIDGKEFPELNKYKSDNLWIVNHIEFQKKLIERTSI
jgi:hypothetical protein